MNAIILKIKRKETPFYAFLYDAQRALRKSGLPSLYAIHKPLYLFSRLLIGARWTLQEKLWSIPLFKTICTKCGARLSLPNGVPWVTQHNLNIEIGDDVTIMKSTLMAGHVYDSPKLRIGNNSTLGYNTMVSVGKEVSIGENVMIAHNVYISDNDGHPLDPERRLNHDAVNADEIKPVIIGNNVWIGAGCVILKGAEIGDNTVVSPNSVISAKALPNKIMMGNPARAIKTV